MKTMQFINYQICEDFLYEIFYLTSFEKIFRYINIQDWGLTDKDWHNACPSGLREEADAK